jgi:SAM-dependent methyltransferase
MTEHTPTFASKSVHGRVERPVPPQALRRRVHGADDLARLELTGNSRVLDFGCGCGRVLTFFQRATGAELYGTDIDGEAIAWTRENLPDIADFQQNANWPPLSFADGFFDFVFSVSVFTHLPRRMQTAWLAELRRVTKPGGYLLLTTHGPHMVPQAPDPAPGRPLRGLRISLNRLMVAARRRKLRRAGFFYLGKIDAEGMPKFYGLSYQTHEGIRAQWGQFFEIEAIVPKGINDHQDLVLCRRPG